MKKITILLLSIYFINFSFSQTIQKCHTNEYIDFLSQSNPDLKNNIQAAFDLAKEYSESIIPTKATAPTTIYRIPVVFHVVYKTNAENITDTQLQSQIDVLNQDFRKLNADTSNYRAIFKDRAADVGFEFFFATIDPDGNPTNGITRTLTTKSSFGGLFPDPNLIDQVKFNSTEGEDAWDTDNYMNIWVCNTGGNILGFAYPPENAPNWPSGQVPSDQGKWGLVISHTVIGFDNPLAPGGAGLADRGRTCVHETGHFFGLRHIWGDAGIFGSIDCDITKDDGIDDTPHMGNNSQNDGCDFSKNTCTNGENPDEPDMPENYMDYSKESCQNMFTEGQATIMQSMAIIGRPDLAYIIKDDTLNIQIGDYIVINGTDTILVDANSQIVINQGDSVLFLNENNGYHYISTTTQTFDINDDIYVKEQGQIIQYNTDGINSLSLNNSLVSIFPNPSKNKIDIINETNHSFSKIMIINTEGKICYQETFSKSNKKSVNISKLLNGLYFVSLYENEQLFSVKKLSVIK